MAARQTSPTRQADAAPDADIVAALATQVTAVTPADRSGAAAGTATQGPSGAPSGPPAGRGAAARTTAVTDDGAGGWPDAPPSEGAAASPRASPRWLRITAFVAACAVMASAGLGLGLLGAPETPATVPLSFYITDAPGALTALHVSVASVTAGPDHVPLQLVQEDLDLASLRGPEDALLLAQGRVPADALHELEVTFSSARATVDGVTLPVPVARSLHVQGIASSAAPAFLFDVDIAQSMVVDGAGNLSFAPVAAAVMAASAGVGEGAGSWAEVAAAPSPPLPEGLQPAGVFLADGVRPSGVDDAGTTGNASGPLDAGPEAPGSDVGNTSIVDNGTFGGAIRTDAVFEDGVTPAWLVLFEDANTTVATMRAAAAEVGAVFVDALASVPVAHVVATQAQADRLAEDPRVTRVEAEVPVTYDDAESWEALRMPAVVDPVGGLRDADGRPIDGRGIGVAVVDTGIDGLHPDFQTSGLVGDSIVVDNRKVVSRATIRMDNTDTTSGHGTHVAAIVAGQGTEGETARGIAHGAGLYGLGIGEASTTLWAAQAFDWIVDNHDDVDPPIRVVTNSWSAGTTYDPDSITTRLVQRMADAGIVVVFSAGNDGGDGSSAQTSAQCRIPYPGVVCVAAYDDHGNGTRDGTIAPYSSRGDVSDRSTWPDVSAPGTDIRSARTLAGYETGVGLARWVALSGTSQAAPHVAGVAALMLQMDAALAPAAVESLLKTTAYPFADGGAYQGGHHAKGHGLVDAYAAVVAAE